MRFSSTEAYCPVTPTQLADHVGLAARRRRRRSRRRPPSIGSRVASIWSIVVLPAPLGPRTPKTSPRRTSRSMPSTARRSPKVLTRPVAPDGQVAPSAVKWWWCHVQRRLRAVPVSRPPSPRFHASGGSTCDAREAQVSRASRGSAPPRKASYVARSPADHDRRRRRALPQPGVEVAAAGRARGAGSAPGSSTTQQVRPVVVAPVSGSVPANVPGCTHSDVAGVGEVDAERRRRPGVNGPTPAARRRTSPRAARRRRRRPAPGRAA